MQIKNEFEKAQNYDNDYEMPYYNFQDEEDNVNQSNDSHPFINHTININNNNSFQMKNQFMNLDSIDSFQFNDQPNGFQINLNSQKQIRQIKSGFRNAKNTNQLDQKEDNDPNNKNSSLHIQMNQINIKQQNLIEMSGKKIGISKLSQNVKSENLEEPSLSLTKKTVWQRDSIGNITSIDTKKFMNEKEQLKYQEKEENAKKSIGLKNTKEECYNSDMILSKNSEGKQLASSINLSMIQNNQTQTSSKTKMPKNIQTVLNQNEINAKVSIQNQSGSYNPNQNYSVAQKLMIDQPLSSQKYKEDNLLSSFQNQKIKKENYPQTKIEIAQMYRDQAKMGILKDCQLNKISDKGNNNRNKNIVLNTQNSADALQTDFSSRAKINPQINTNRISFQDQNSKRDFKNKTGLKDNAQRMKGSVSLNQNEQLVRMMKIMSQSPDYNYKQNQPLTPQNNQINDNILQSKQYEMIQKQQNFFDSKIRNSDFYVNKKFVIAQNFKLQQQRLLNESGSSAVQRCYMATAQNQKLIKLPQKQNSIDYKTPSQNKNIKIIPNLLHKNLQINIKQMLPTLNISNINQLQNSEQKKNKLQQKIQQVYQIDKDPHQNQALQVMEFQEKKKKSILGGRSKRYRLDEIIDPLNDIKNIDLKLIRPIQQVNVDNLFRRKLFNGTVNAKNKDLLLPGQFQDSKKIVIKQNVMNQKTNQNITTDRESSNQQYKKYLIQSNDVNFYKQNHGYLKQKTQKYQNDNYEDSKIQQINMKRTDSRQSIKSQTNQGETLQIDIPRVSDSLESLINRTKTASVAKQKERNIKSKLNQIQYNDDYQDQIETQSLEKQLLQGYINNLQRSKLNQTTYYGQNSLDHKSNAISHLYSQKTNAYNNESIQSTLQNTIKRKNSGEKINLVLQDGQSSMMNGIIEGKQMKVRQLSKCNQKLKKPEIDFNKYYSHLYKKDYDQNTEQTFSDFNDKTNLSSLAKFDLLNNLNKQLNQTIKTTSIDKIIKHDD